MNRLLSFCVVSLLACLVLTITQSSVTAQDQLANSTDIPELFGGDIRSEKIQDSADPTVVRSRAVRINIDLLGNLKTNDEFVFNLFEDAAFTAQLEMIKNGNTLYGSIEGKLAGSFTLVISDEGTISAIIRVPGNGMYRVRSLREGVVKVQEIDESRFPQCGLGPDPAQNVLADGGVTAEAGVGCDDGSVIEILVLYTPLARSAAGGTAAIEAEIHLAVANANIAYSNSLIGTQIILAHIEEIAYDENGTYQDHLLRLTSPTDGIMDEVHSLRNLYFADMVALIVDDGEYCGMAWLMQENSHASQNIAFSVTTWYCAANLILAHELGHNMGCCHAVGDGGGCLDNGGLFSYSNGYRFFGNSNELWRTVMAYAPGNRISHFSDPDILFDGQPTGVAPGDPDEAHNAFTINQTATTIANFRCHTNYSQTLKLLPNDGEMGDQFGISVSISGQSGDEIALIGAFHDDDNGNNSGSAYFFDTSNGQQIYKLLPDDGEADDQFGYAVGISGSPGKEIAIVGANGDDDNGSNSGSAYLFDVSTGQQIAKLLPNDGAVSDKFGFSVAINGIIAVAGACYDDDNGADSGSAYLFDTTTGIQIAKLLPIDGTAGDLFGCSVAISGTRCIVGAKNDDANGPGSGSAYIIDITGSQIVKLLPNDGAEQDHFGSSVAISGNTAIVGAIGGDSNGFNSGVAYLFDALTGQQIAKLIPGDGFNSDQFGYSVAIKGVTAVVGARFHDAHVDNSGAAYIYDISDLANPVLTAKIFASDEMSGDTFGTSVAIGGAPGVEVVIVGSVWDDDNGNSSGSAYVYVNQDGPGIPGDLDGDGVVNTNDLLILFANWGICDDCNNCPADLNIDCSVNTSDLLMLFANWG